MSHLYHVKTAFQHMFAGISTLGIPARGVRSDVTLNDRSLVWVYRCWWYHHNGVHLSLRSVGKYLRLSVACQSSGYTRVVDTTIEKTPCLWDRRWIPSNSQWSAIILEVLTLMIRPRETHHIFGTRRHLVESLNGIHEFLVYQGCWYHHVEGILPVRWVLSFQYLSMVCNRFEYTDVDGTTTWDTSYLGDETISRRVSQWYPRVLSISALLIRAYGEYLGSEETWSFLGISRAEAAVSKVEDARTTSWDESDHWDEVAIPRGSLWST